MQQPILDDLLAAFEEIRETARIGTGAYRRDVEDVVRLVANRGEALGGHLRQLVRLVRLASLCSSRVYVEFFEIALRSARPRLLGSIIAQSLVERGVPKSQVVVEGGRVLFMEPAMRPSHGETAAFEIALEQMPKLGALHHVLCRFLHYQRLYNGQAIKDPAAPDEDKGLFWPIVMAEPPCEADDVARLLQSTLSLHLTRVLGSTGHAARQVHVIAKFLKARSPDGRGRAPEIIDNELLFDFWRTEALADEEGFKLYRSAVTKMLRYRRALMCAQAESSPHLSLGGASAEGGVDLDRLMIAPLGSADWTEPANPQALFETSDWLSPMLTLIPLFKTVKILNESECSQLSNLLDGCDSSGDDATEDDDSGMAAASNHRLTLNREFARPAGSALMGRDRFDLRLGRVDGLSQDDSFGIPKSVCR